MTTPDPTPTGRAPSLMDELTPLLLEWAQARDWELHGAAVDDRLALDAAHEVTATKWHAVVEAVERRDTPQKPVAPDDEHLRFVGALAEAREIMSAVLDGRFYARTEARRWLKQYDEGAFHTAAGRGAALEKENAELRDKVTELEATIAAMFNAQPKVPLAELAKEDEP